ncbi:MAG TPA: cytochrome c [Steroidobacteraceae bacterium]|nr:cytochrome c [Steroidobacteraceae bacterium]
MTLQRLRFGVRTGVLIAAICGAVAGAPSRAQEAQGNPQRGKALSYTCLGCHGVDGYKNAYPNYSVPELEGQHPEYLAAALHGYRDGDRAHLTMHSQASTLSDQDIADIVAYFAGKPLTSSGKAQGTIPQAAQLCTSCHGQDGVGITPQYPTLAGQHPDYIVRALQEYKKGGRKNPIMSAMAAQVKDEDMAVIAEYFSSLKPSLATESRPYTILGEEHAGH